MKQNADSKITRVKELKEKKSMSTKYSVKKTKHFKLSREMIGVGRRTRATTN